MVVYITTSGSDSFTLIYVLKTFVVVIGFILMVAQAIYIEVFFNCLKFETSDLLD